MFSLFPWSNIKEATLIQRYKRFLADVKLEDSSEITVHCPNPGAMLGINQPGAKVMLSPINSKNARLPYRLQAININNKWIGVDTILPNKLVEFYLEKKEIKQLSNFKSFKKEVKYGKGDKASKIDFLLSNPNETLFLEIKNAHLEREKGIAEFPDSVTTRGAKHMYALGEEAIKPNTRAMVLYIIQRDDCNFFKIASDLDPNYRKAVDYAKSNGVEFLAFNTSITKIGTKILNEIKII